MTKSDNYDNYILMWILCMYILCIGYEYNVYYVFIYNLIMYIISFFFFFIIILTNFQILLIFIAYYE